MSLLFAKAAMLGWGVAATTTATPWWVNNEEAPPRTLALWIGLGLGAAVCAGVAAGIRLQRRRQTRAASVLPEDPFAVDALRAGVRLFSELDRGWTERDSGRLLEIASPQLAGLWRARLQGPPRPELAVDGPVRFSYVAAADPVAGVEQRGLLRVEGRLRAPTKQMTLSRRQRNGLLGLAATILAAAFVGIALAPASKITSAGPTTIIVRDGVPLGGTHLLTYRTGALIDLTVRSDVADEVHFHGYDIHKDVTPGRPVHFLLRATIQGSYPVELEQHAETLAQVSVQP